MLFKIYKKEIILCLIFSFLFGFQFHFSSWWPISWVVLTPLLYMIHLCSSRKEALIFGYLSGVISTAITYYWILHVTLTGFVAMCIYLGIYTALFCYLSYWQIKGLARIGRKYFLTASLKLVVIASGWAGIEWVRSNIPIMKFPWALLPYSQWKNTPVIQSLDWIGPYGLSFVMAMGSVGLFAVISVFNLSFRKKIKNSQFLLQLFLICLISLGVIIGHHFLCRFSQENFLMDKSKTQYRISVVQGNIPQEEKWDERIKNMIFRKYEGLSRQLEIDDPDLVIWPETSFPGYWEYEPELVNRSMRLAKQIPSFLLIGAPTLREGDDGVERMNSAIMLNDHGLETARYHKLRLVPFGEYIPFFKFIRNFFDDIGRFSPGEEYTLFDMPIVAKKIEHQLAILICFEDIFPDLCRQFVRQGADLLVNITNDAWFKKSIGPYQHAQSSVFRAVENRVPVVRAANTGLSCFIDPLGNIWQSVKNEGEEIMVTGFKTENVLLGNNQSFYTQRGDIIFYILMGLGIVLSLTHKRIKGGSRDRYYSDFKH